MTNSHEQAGIAGDVLSANWYLDAGVVTTGSSGPCASIFQALLSRFDVAAVVTVLALMVLA